MITRIFRVEIVPSLRGEFEPLFQTVSVESVQGADGFIRLDIGRPTDETPNEYMMISVWESEESLIKYVGPNWTEAHIPSGMKNFVVQCWVHHFREF